MNDETHDEPQTMDDVAEDITMFVHDLRQYAFSSAQALRVLALPKPLSEDEQKQLLDHIMQRQEQILTVAAELQEYGNNLRHLHPDHGDQQ